MYFPFLLTDDGSEFLEFVTEGVQVRCAQIIAELLDEIESPFDETEPSKQLIRFHRISNVAGMSKPTRDWGLSAEFASILEMKAVKDLVADVAAIDPKIYRKKKEVLEASLLATFDSYNSESELFKFTTGASFSRILNLFTNESAPDSSGLEELDSKIYRICNEGITERDLVNLVSSYASTPKQQLTNIDAQGIKDLLLTKIEFGEYTPDGIICDVSKWEKRVQKAVTNSTIDFYNSDLVDLHVKRYELSPQVDLVSKIFGRFSAINEKDEKNTILDIGCGVGQYAEFFIQQGFNTYLMDASNKMLDMAYNRLNISKDKLNLCSIFADNWGYSDEFFDIIFASAIMVHVPKKEVAKIYKSFQKVLKPNGLLFVNFKIGDHSLIAADGRFFEYYRDIDQPRQDLLTAGFRVDDIILRTNNQNMYYDPKEISWANYYCQKARDNNCAR